jgi:hypothetical protein
MWLIFFQIQFIFYATTCNCWSYEMVFWHFVGMLKSMNYARVLHLFLLYQKGTLKDLFQKPNLHEGIKPYIIGENGYLLLLWLMVSHKQIQIMC